MFILTSSGPPLYNASPVHHAQWVYGIVDYGLPDAEPLTGYLQNL